MDWNMWSAIGACGSAIASLWALCYARKALNTWNRQEQFKVKFEFKRALLELEDCYFSQKQPVSARQSHPAIPFPKERRFIVTVSPDGTADTQPLPDDVFIGKVSSILSDLRQMGWIIIKRDLLAEKLATW